MLIIVIVIINKFAKIRYSSSNKKVKKIIPTNWNDVRKKKANKNEINKVKLTEYVVVCK